MGLSESLNGIRGLAAPAILAPLIFLFGCGGGSSGPAAQDTAQISLFAGETTSNLSTSGQCLNGPFRSTPDIANDNNGNIFAADPAGYRILRFGSQGNVDTFAGGADRGLADGQGGSARFWYPTSIGLDTGGNVYVTDTVLYLATAGFNAWHSTIRKISKDGQVSTLAGADFVGDGAAGTSDGQGPAARFSVPLGLAADATGNIFVGEPNSSTIRKIDGAGKVSTYAGMPGARSAIDGNISAARFISPRDLVPDIQGNLYVLDAGTYAGEQGSAVRNSAAIRKISVDGQVSTLAGSADGIGSADGAGKAATFNFPESMTINPASGTLYIADTQNHTIRKVTKDGVVTTLAGVSGQAGIKLGKLPGGLSSPKGITFVPPNSLYVSTQCAILKISPVSY